jgi:hypothetical protein
MFEQWEKNFDCVLALLPKIMNLWFLVSEPISHFAIIFFETLVKLSQQASVDILEQLFNLVFAVLSDVLFEPSREIDSFRAACCETTLQYVLTIVQDSNHFFTKWLVNILPERFIQFIDRLIDDVINNILSCL